MPASVIVLTGPPGAGKSTVAPLVADGFEASVLLPADEFWHYIRRGHIAPFLAEAHEQNAVVTEILGSVAAGYAGAGYEVVVDGIVGPWFLDRFLTRLRPAGLVVHYVVLRPSETVASARATGRASGALTDLSRVRQMYREFSELGRYENHVIDSTRLPPEEVAEVVIQAVWRGDMAVLDG